MRKTVLLLFAFLSAIVCYGIRPYPETGALFNTGSTTCAIGRPLNEVVAELLDNSNFFDAETDYVNLRTSSNQHTYNKAKGGIELPALSEEDTLLYVEKHEIKGKGEGGLNDTCFIFGIYFSPSNEDELRQVKLLRVSYFTIYESIPLTPFTVDWSQNYSQTAEIFLNFLSPDYFNNKLGNDCPSPNETRAAEEDYSDMARTDGKNVLYRKTDKISATTSTHQVKYYKTDYIVGQMNYCPVEVELNEDICQGESYTFGNHVLNQTTDDILKTKTWYGADSTTILHLTVHDTASTTIDTTLHSGQSLVIDGKQITQSGNYTEKEQTVYGCDSVVTYRVKVLGNDTIHFPAIKPGIVVTPNDDGVNDTWQIVNIDKYNIYTIRIYSRSGKELALYKNHYDGWDGTYKGKKLPSADYWYAISLDESDETIQGHFTLTWE